MSTPNKRVSLMESRLLHLRERGLFELHRSRFGHAQNLTELGQRDATPLRHVERAGLAHGFETRPLLRIGPDVVAARHVRARARSIDALGAGRGEADAGHVPTSSSARSRAPRFVRSHPFTSICRSSPNFDRSSPNLAASSPNLAASSPNLAASSPNLAASSPNTRAACIFARACIRTRAIAYSARRWCAPSRRARRLARRRQARRGASPAARDSPRAALASLLARCR